MYTAFLAPGRSWQDANMATDGQNIGGFAVQMRLNSPQLLADQPHPMRESGAHRFQTLECSVEQSRPD